MSYPGVFNNGKCDLFARELHKLTGWKIKQLDLFKIHPYKSNWRSYVWDWLEGFHVFCITPCGKYADINGFHDPDIVEKWTLTLKTKKIGKRYGDYIMPKNYEFRIKNFQYIEKPVTDRDITEAQKYAQIVYDDYITL